MAGNLGARFDNSSLVRVSIRVNRAATAGEEQPATAG